MFRMVKNYIFPQQVGHALKNKEHSGWVNLKQRFLCLYNEENCMMGGTILVWAVSDDAHAYSHVLSIWDEAEEVPGIKITFLEFNVYDS